LDLDETLVHSTMDSSKHKPNNSITLEIYWEDKLSTVYVNLRPGIFDFLKKMTRIYEIVIFTASVSNYANPLIDQHLDKTNYGFHKLYRENCTFKSGYYVKDLSRLGR